MQTIAHRLEVAAEAWGGLWAGGEPYAVVTDTPLVDIIGADLRKVLRRQGNGKARGADGWSPRDLGALPGRWVDALGRQMRDWEAAAR